MLSTSSSLSSKFRCTFVNVCNFSSIWESCGAVCLVFRLVGLSSSLLVSSRVVILPTRSAIMFSRCSILPYCSLFRIS
jgi:hypothetical protein